MLTKDQEKVKEGEEICAIKCAIKIQKSQHGQNCKIVQNYKECVCSSITTSKARPLKNDTHCVIQNLLETKKWQPMWPKFPKYFSEWTHSSNSRRPKSKIVMTNWGDGLISSDRMKAQRRQSSSPSSSSWSSSIDRRVRPVDTLPIGHRRWETTIARFSIQLACSPSTPQWHIACRPRKLLLKQTKSSYSVDAKSKKKTSWLDARPMMDETTTANYSWKDSCRRNSRREMNKSAAN